MGWFVRRHADRLGAEEQWASVPVSTEGRRTVGWDVVGEMSVVTDMLRNFGPALRIERAQLMEIIEEYPRVAVEILRTVSARLVEAIETY